MKKYIPKDIEPKWQKKWTDSGIYKTDLSKSEKCYVLAEYAYPSGDLHMGHWFTWSGADVYARFKRMQGFNVFFPNGFDSFGLPAEGAAIKRGIHPKDWTEDNIERMKVQYQSMGPSFDFYGDLASHKSEYYQWNQWIFLKMLEKGIAYKGKYLSNWCPIDQTVLANEAVEAGKCWRCGSEVVQKEIEQWFYKITDYSDELIWPENPVVNWPKSVRDAQNEWIGKSEGMKITFKIEDSNETVTVYTVYPETIFGITYMVLAPEHTLIDKITSKDQKEAVTKYIEQTKKKSEQERKEGEKDKTGVFTGAYIINPVNNKKAPIWIADYVIASYGTGAVMGVPGSDHRDFEFAQKYNLDIIRVIGKNTNDNGPIEDITQVLEEGILVNSEQFTGLTTPAEARDKVKDFLEEKGFGQRSKQYHLHDWSISRQRYWGTPIPIINCPKCGSVPVPEEDLPVELPYEVDYQPKGKPPLASNEAWLKVKCPSCGGDAERDPETMDTFVDSSWYFFRFLDTNYNQAPFSKELASKIMPVDIYFGGAEHTLGHTLYSRFFTKFFKDLKLTDLSEFALRRINHGIILGPDGQKMSKSRGNVINPDDEVKKYGADTIRVYLAFFMPYEATGPWDPERVNGPYRFLQRVWGLIDKVEDLPPTDTDLRQLNKTIKDISEDIEGVKFNTAVAWLMQWLNYLSAKDQVSKTEYKTLLLLLSPFAPHITEELWQELGETESIHTQPWSKVEEKYLEDETLTIMVQVNGKVRESLVIEKDIISDRKKVENLALNSPKVQKFLKGLTPKQIIYVPGKIINIVASLT